jgi:hypothetical protein
MKYRLPILTAVWMGMAAAPALLVSQPPGPAAGAEKTAPVSPPGEVLMAQVADRLDRYKSISAKMRYRSELFGQRIIGNGEYRQGASSGDLVRWDSKLQVGSSLLSLQQIGDGQYLWTYRQQEKTSTLSRIDVQRVLDAERARPQSVPGGMQNLGLGAIGGLPRLLRRLDRSFRFTSLTESKVGKLPVYVLRGGWEPAMLVQMLPDQQAEIQAGQPVDLQKLPEHIPDQVTVMVGRDDWFPYLIDYQRQAGPSGSSPRSLMMIELYEVRCNVKLERLLFTYQPGDVPVIDQTDVYIANALASP